MGVFFHRWGYKYGIHTVGILGEGISPFLGVLNPHSILFPTCQVRVVRFYQSCRLLLPPPPPPPPPSPRLLLPPVLNHGHPRPVLAAGPQPRPSPPSVGCRTSTTAIPAQCWLPDLNHGHPRPVLAAGPTTAIPAQCWLPDLNHGHPRPVLAAGPQPRPSPPSVGCRTSTTAIPAQCWLPDLNHGHPRPVLAAGPQPPCQI